MNVPAAPQSPCIGVCKLNPSGICQGCGRTLDEIAQWPAASDAQRQVILAAARRRRTELMKKEAAR